MNLSSNTRRKGGKSLESLILRLFSASDRITDFNDSWEEKASGVEEMDGCKWDVIYTRLKHCGGVH